MTSTEADRDVLPRSVRIGYGSGSVATGAFGTVPGLMLLPYLTDSRMREALLVAFLDRLTRPLAQ